MKLAIVLSIISVLCQSSLSRPHPQTEERYWKNLATFVPSELKLGRTGSDGDLRRPPGPDDARPALRRVMSDGQLPPYYEDQMDADSEEEEEYVNDRPRSTGRKRGRGTDDPEGDEERPAKKEMSTVKKVGIGAAVVAGLAGITGLGLGAAAAAGAFNDDDDKNNNAAPPPAAATRPIPAAAMISGNGTVNGTPPVAGRSETAKTNSATIINPLTGKPM